MKIDPYYPSWPYSLHILLIRDVKSQRIVDQKTCNKYFLLIGGHDQVVLKRIGRISLNILITWRCNFSRFTFYFILKSEFKLSNIFQIIEITENSVWLDSTVNDARKILQRKKFYVWLVPLGYFRAWGWLIGN